MKIIHTSDIHLGSPITAHLDGARAAIRRRELQDGFAQLVRRATELGADGVIIAGDLFDGEPVSRRLIETTLATVASAPELTFFYLPGNHEGDALRASGATLPENLLIFGREWTYFKLGGVTVAGRSELSEDIFGSFSAGDGRCVAVLHGELREGRSTKDAIGAGELAGRGIDYLALGHYHTYSARNIGGCSAVYSGTPFGRGFDEAGEKGFALVEVTERGVTHSFIPMGGRRLQILHADITGDLTQSDVEGTVGRALLGVRREDMVRVVLVGDRAEGVIRDTESIARRFSSEFFYFEVKDQTRLALRAEDYALDRSLKGEFVRTVLADGALDAEERDRIIECGLRALDGEAAYGRSSY